MSLTTYIDTCEPLGSSYAGVTISFFGFSAAVNFFSTVPITVSDESVGTHIIRAGARGIAYVGRVRYMDWWLASRNIAPRMAGIETNVVNILFVVKGVELSNRATVQQLASNEIVQRTKLEHAQNIGQIKSLNASPTSHYTIIVHEKMSRRETRAVVPRRRTADAVHERAAALQFAAGDAGVALNRKLSATARPLARAGGGLRRAHSSGKRAAQAASKAVAECANTSRRVVHRTAEAARPVAGDAVDIAVGLFEMTAAAPVFAAQALHSPPHLSIQNKPHNPPRPTHHWQNGAWVPVQPALDQNGHPYKPPPGYPTAKKKRRGESSKRKGKR